jgi:hypothetical protein
MFRVELSILTNGEMTTQHSRDASTEAVKSLREWYLKELADLQDEVAQLRNEVAADRALLHELREWVRLDLRAYGEVTIQ